MRLGEPLARKAGVAGRAQAHEESFARLIAARGGCRTVHLVLVIVAQVCHIMLLLTFRNDPAGARVPENIYRDLLLQDEKASESLWKKGRQV